MVNRRDTLKLAAGAALGLQAAPVVASEGQETTTDEEETTTVEDDLSGVFLAGLTGGQQTPPVETEAEGSAVFVVNMDGSVDYAVAVQDIENVNQAHIHAGNVGESGEVVVWLYPSPEAEEPELMDGEFSGMLATGTFEDEHLTGPLEGESIEAAVQAMEEEGAYVNVHTEQNPGGEIRGQIVTVDRMVDCLGFEQQATTTPEEETTPEEVEETTPEEAEETTPEEMEETTPEEVEETTPEDEVEETTVLDEEETTTT